MSSKEKDATDAYTIAYMSNKKLEKCQSCSGSGFKSNTGSYGAFDIIGCGPCPACKGTGDVVTWKHLNLEALSTLVLVDEGTGLRQDGPKIDKPNYELPIIDGYYSHPNGALYKVIMIANKNLKSNKNSEWADEEFPLMVVYKDIASDRVYARKPEHFNRKMRLKAC